MKNASKTILFFGSGPVAAASLRLLAKDFTVEAVVTKPAPTHHRGPVPVVEAAQELGLKTLLVSNKAELSALIAAQPAHSPVGIVIDFGIMISQDVIDAFPFGIINSHFSLLPQWRGADPITFSILSGQKTTGVSLMLIVEALDEGPLLAQAEYELPTGITTPELTNDLVELSHSMLCEIVPLYLEDKTQPAPQEEVTMADSPEPTYSRKLTKDDGNLDWQKPAAQLEREVRAFLGWPGSRTTLADKSVTVLKTHVVEQKHPVGSVHTEDKQLVIGCSDQSLAIDSLKPAGKAAMSAEAFLAGHKHLL